MKEILGEPLTFMSVATELREAHELCAGGQEMDVTEDNKLEYLDMLCEDYFCAGMRHQIGVLLEGFWDIVPRTALANADVSFRELVVMIAGFDEIDVKNWRMHSNVEGDSKVLRWFWDVISEFTQTDLGVLLHFATGSSRLPAGGFEMLEPRFQVHVNSGENVTHLPHAHTCFNLLMMPAYESREDLKSKLKIAIANDTGFGFA